MAACAAPTAATCIALIRECVLGEKSMNGRWFMWCAWAVQVCVPINFLPHPEIYRLGQPDAAAAAAAVPRLCQLTDRYCDSTRSESICCKNNETRDTMPTSRERGDRPAALLPLRSRTDASLGAAARSAPAPRSHACSAAVQTQSSSAPARPCCGLIGPAASSPDSRSESHTRHSKQNRTS